MFLNCLDRVADWNPQLFRELKGRLNAHNVGLAVVSSLVIQLLLFLFWWQDSFQKQFLSLNVIIIFALLVVGSYLLISDLAKEERRGTLNFIRFSPQSAQSILIGKMLGVPVLLYLAVLLAIPLNLGLGLSAHIPFLVIFCFYAVLVASCAFFYSIALVLSLVSPWFSGLQAWLGGGAVFWFLFFTTNQAVPQSPTGWLNLFSPSGVLLYLVNLAESAENDTDLSYYLFGANNHQLFDHLDISDLEWFNLPLGATFLSLVIFTLLNYGFGTY
ncbi:MAG: ABC transporter permease subunit, partial [Cyanobacteriota bacterium]